MAAKRVRLAIVTSVAAAGLIATAGFVLAEGGRAGQGVTVGPPQAAAPKGPAPAEALKSMAFFAGAWRCAGRNSSPEGKSFPVEATARVEVRHDGSWLMFDLREIRTKDNPRPASGTWMWGFESAHNRYSGFFFDSIGNRTEQYAPGWRDGGLLFEGRILGPGFEAPYKDVIRKTGDASFSISGQGYVVGKWIVFQHLDCHR
ncbi:MULTISPECIES: DUF1579 family protein [unclassified Nonomuraea]|uniref:DUF1579 family protein n=1 Tax=unclassified Nonomuraea TaxID=2593643 RepID=UPI0035C21E60